MVALNESAGLVGTVPVQSLTEGQSSLCNEHEESRRITAVQRLDGYRQRLDAASGSDERNAVHETIAGELAANHTQLAGCAAALLSTRLRPREHSNAWNTLSAIRDSDVAIKNGSEAAACLRLCAQVAAHWSAAIVERYAWASRARSFLERLWSVAQLHQDWATAVRYLNAVLVLRHELVLLGRLSPSMRHWQTIGNELGAGIDRLYYSPVTATDLKNVLDWAANSYLEFGGLRLESLDQAEKVVVHWTRATAEGIELADGSCLSSRPQSIWSRCMIAYDTAGLITREDTLKRRPYRRDLSAGRATKRPRLADSGNDLAGDRSQAFASSSTSFPNDGQSNLVSEDARVRDQQHGSAQIPVLSTSPAGELEEPESSDDELSELTGPDTHDGDDDREGLEAAKQSEQVDDSDDDNHFEGTIGTEQSDLADEAEDRASQPSSVGRYGNTPNEDHNDVDSVDARSSIGSVSAPESLQDEHSSVSGPRQSDSSDGGQSEDGVQTPNSTISSMTDMDCRSHAQSFDCPHCEGLCVAGFVPESIHDSNGRSDLMSPNRRTGFEVIHGINRLVSDRCETDAKAQILRAWTSPSHLASVFFDPDDDLLSTASREEAEVWCLDSDRLHHYLCMGVILDRPILIKNAVRDPRWLTWNKCQAILRSKLEGRVLQVRDPITHTLMDIEGEDVLEESMSPDVAYNALNLPGLVRGDRPAFTLLPQYRLLEDLMYSEAWDEMSKQTTTKELDIIGCTRFNILGLRGAFSGAHLDTLNGTWIRSFCGRKAWMFVPPNQLDESDMRRLARDGDEYDPRGKGRIVIIEQDEVLLMPPGVNVVHAVLTLETSLMEGAMLWDESRVNDTLKNMHWIAMHQLATNEPWPKHIQAIVKQLDRAVVLDTERFAGNFGCSEDFMRVYVQHSRAIHALPCRCASRCGRSCSCRTAQRRCTPECRSHAGRALMCFRDA